MWEAQVSICLKEIETMTTSLKAFDEKIQALKQKKKELQNKQAQQLFKATSYIIGGSFSPQLAACIVDDSWNNASPEKKEGWIKSSKKFQFTKPRKSRKTSYQNSKTN